MLTPEQMAEGRERLRAMLPAATARAAEMRAAVRAAPPRPAAGGLSLAALLRANAFTVADRTVWLRISRLDHVYAFHASTDGTTWQLVRVFTLGDAPADHRIGFEAQSPTGDGCTVTFDRIRFTPERLPDLRDGS